ncbi:MAG: M1 family metallopeptidase [Bacteroidota bacterium]|jgi:aminopeptidase N
MYKKILFALAITCNGVFAQNTYRSYLKDQTAYREHPLDITRMKVEVAFEPNAGLVKGKVTHSFMVLQKQVDSVFFDAPGIRIKNASLNGKTLAFQTNGKGVWVKPATPLIWDQNGQIVFEYEANPRKGIYFIGWNATDNPEQSPWAVRKQIWTQGQGIDNRYWIPMYDDMNDKFITETVITFNKDYEVLSNGTLLKKTANKDQTITWHYSMTRPHAGYLLMLGIGKYAIKESKSARGVPMKFYYYPEFASRLEPTYRYSERMVDFLEKETGILYPWESYSQIMVQDFLYGAMENTTATIFGDFFNVDARAFKDRNYVGVNCHELTHQWFGDFITARDGRDTWLQESYATYYPKMFNREILGEDDYNWQRRGEHNTALEASKKDRNPIRHTQAGTARVYPKGSAVISMLSYVLGDEQWKRALNHYLKTHAYANVETNDLQQAIQDKLGIDLSWFFDQWILRGGEPHYTIHYEDLIYNDGSRATEVAVEQTHLRDEVVGLFKMPIAIEVHYTDGSSDKITEWIEEAFEMVKIQNKNKKEIAYVLFDPNSMVLKSVTFKKGFNQLKAQLLKATNMLDRYDALVALKDFPLDKKRTLLIEVLSKETFHAMKTEAINQLSGDNETASIVAKVFELYHSSPKLAAIKHAPDDIFWKERLIKCLSDSSYDVVGAALEKLCKGYPAEAESFLNQTKGLDGTTNNLRVKWHELAASYNIEKDKNLDALVWLSSNAWEFRTRNNAFASLKALNHCNPQLAAHLLDAVTSTNGRLSGPATQLIEHFALQTTYRNLFIQSYKQVADNAKRDLIKKQLSFLP